MSQPCEPTYVACLSCVTSEQDKVYEDNLEASVAVLKKLSDQWKELSVKLSPLDPMRETLKNFRHKVPYLYFWRFFMMLLP